MLTEEQKTKFSSMRVEIINLNILAGFYIRKLNRFNYITQNTSRHFMLEELTALRYMENGIILHLINLDDKSSEYSFRKILIELNKIHCEQKKLKNLQKLLKNYRAELLTLKDKHRNKHIAHLNYIKDKKFDEFLNYDNYLKPMISNANQIGDEIWGKRIEYRFKLGSFEGIINFRDIFEFSKVNYSAENDF
jgi:hypothetical protein